MRMVATDLDGTIVGADETISPRTVAALQACQDAGVLVVYVTGRPPRWMRSVSEQTGHRGVALCCNGAAVYDLGSEQVLHWRPVTPQVVLDVASRLIALYPQAAFAIETTKGLRRTSDFVARWDGEIDYPVGPLEDLLSDSPQVLKILCRVESGNGDELLAQAIAALHGIATPTHSNARDCLLEISALGVGKESALAELARERDINSTDVVAFGDMPNDLGMLAWAGRGYAMSDGHPDVLAQAELVTAPVTEDGVAQVLEELLAAASEDDYSPLRRSGLE